MDDINVANNKQNIELNAIGLGKIDNNADIDHNADELNRANNNMDMVYYLWQQE